MTNLDIVNAYFAAIRDKDADGLRPLFAADAQLTTLAGTFTGPDAIASFYRDLAFTVDDLWPEPGVPLIDQDRVAVEIRLRMHGNVSLVSDFFTFAAGKISRLIVYNGAPAPEPDS
ncbi:MAG: nuclear transport factor 2 family protein [Acidimicrobiia bacterium]